MPLRLNEAEVSINGHVLSAQQSATLRVALICAGIDFKKLRPDIVTAGHANRIDEMLRLIGETKVSI